MNELEAIQSLDDSCLIHKYTDDCIISLRKDIEELKEMIQNGKEKKQ